MESQDWIDYKLGILAHEKCKEYGYYSPQEIKAYGERFPNCNNVYREIYENGDISCHCIYGAWGNSDGTCNVNCYMCTHYTPKVNYAKKLIEVMENEADICWDAFKFQLNNPNSNKEELKILSNAMITYIKNLTILNK